jgi:ABC-type branched-subunit amino acid transport system substrate-binding protein
MNPTTRAAWAVACAAALALSACGSDDESSDNGGGGQSAGDGPIKLGLLTPASGPVASGFTGLEEGANARLQAYKDAGGTCADTEFDVVVGDDTGSPQGALAAAQRLVQQEDVYAVLPITPYGPGASGFLATQDTPVVGASWDQAPEWRDQDARNFFSIQGSEDPRNIPSTWGDYFESVGGTKVAVVGIPESDVVVRAVVESATAAGLQEGYVNTSVPLGSTDVGPIVLGIRDSGSDVLYLPLTADLNFAIVAGLRQAGVEMKAIVLATGYGADLLASPPAVEAAQGVRFFTAAAPIELETDATKFQAEALRQYAGSPSGLPTYSQGQGWLAADLFLHGLEAAGCDASQSDFIDALRDSADWDAGGLYTQPVDFSEYGVLANAHGPGNCFYISILQGEGFVPDENAAPICGDIIGQVDD